MARFDIHFFAESLKRNIRCTMVIPAETPSDAFLEGQRYKTLYLLHPGHGRGEDWLDYSFIEQYAEANKVALVMPNLQNSACRDLADGDRFLHLVTEELPSFLAQVFPLARKRENRWILGAGIGGFGALHAAFTHGEVFSRCAVISGMTDLSAFIATCPANYQKLLLNTEDGGPILSFKGEDASVLPEFLFASGSQDRNRGQMWKLAETLKDKGGEVELKVLDGNRGWEITDALMPHLFDWFIPEGKPLYE